MCDLDLLVHYTIKYHQEIKKICLPLIDHLGISFFTYYSIDSTGHFVTLSNQPEQLEFYYSQKCYLHNPYLVSPLLLRSGCMFTHQTPDSNYQETLEQSKDKFQVMDPFLILERDLDSIKGFFFAFKEKGNVLSYLNYLEVLKRFNRYFLQEAKPIIKKIKDKHFNLQEVKGKAFLERDPSLPLSYYDSNVQKFLKSISYLSPREESCLELFKQGYSAEETAEKLRLSKRTIEHYFESIKKKLGISSKRELLTR